MYGPFGSSLMEVHRLKKGKQSWKQKFREKLRKMKVGRSILNQWNSNCELYFPSKQLKNILLCRKMILSIILKIECEIFCWCIGVNEIKCCTTLWNVFSQRRFHCVGRLEKVHSRFLLFPPFPHFENFCQDLMARVSLFFPHFLICKAIALIQLVWARKGKILYFLEGETLVETQNNFPFGIMNSRTPIISISRHLP